MAIVDSGVMAERLSGGNPALALLGNTLATGAALVVLIATLGTISSAHFYPAVTLYFALRREMPPAQAAAYAAVQLAGSAAGVLLSHAMFAVPLFELSTKLRDGPSQWLAEFVATLGLLATVAGSLRFAHAATPALVGLYIASAYWFTASTSFANPAVTLARALTDSFSGIAPHSVPGFLAAQFAAVFAGYVCLGWLFEPQAA